MQNVNLAHNRTSIPVAVYCALAEEREYLATRWGLTAYEGTDYWTGEVKGVKLILYTSNQMGRVAAALSTMKFLGQFDPGLLMVLGIAGGFEKEGVATGDVLVPHQVADMATRKVYESDQKARPEFRPLSHQVNDKLLDFLNGAKFSRSEWSANAAKDGEWEYGKLPVLRMGGIIASTDEVVSSTEWSDSLRAAWPKLHGIEMESGGVCAAARLFSVPVSVIRGVSDLANPVKSDDQWRRKAMKAVASLVEAAFEAKVLP